MTSSGQDLQEPFGHQTPWHGRTDSWERNLGWNAFEILPWTVFTKHNCLALSGLVGAGKFLGYFFGNIQHFQLTSWHLDILTEMTGTGPDWQASQNIYSHHRHSISGDLPSLHTRHSVCTLYRAQCKFFVKLKSRTKPTFALGMCLKRAKLFSSKLAGLSLWRLECIYWSVGRKWVLYSDTVTMVL